MVTSDRIRWSLSGLHPFALRLDDAPITAGEISAADLRASIAQLHPPTQVRRLICTIEKDQGHHILRANGFEIVDHCKILSIPLPTDWCADADGLTFRWVSPGEQDDWDAWYHAHWLSYHRTHALNPPKDPGPGEYQDWFGEDLCQALFVERDRTFVGFGSLRSDHQLGWHDTLSEEAGELAAILCVMLRRATELGWPHAELEVDAFGTPDLWALCEDFAECPQECYDIWHRTVGP